MADQERRTYDFKSVGIRQEDELAQLQAIVPKPKPIGIKTPLEFGEGTGLLKMHTSMFAQLADNLRNLVMTNHGERIGHHDFGANLLPLVFELGNPDFDGEAIRRIKTSVGKYMPYVNLKTFTPLVDRLDNKEVAKVGIRITYDVPKLNSGDKILEVILYVGG